MSERTFRPGDQVIRMAPDFAGVYRFQTYDVAAFNPHTVDGLELLGIPGRWNAENFELVAAGFRD